jgi:hypothetical protein
MHIYIYVVALSFISPSLLHNYYIYLHRLALSSKSCCYMVYYVVLLQACQPQTKWMASKFAIVRTQVTSYRAIEPSNHRIEPAEQQATYLKDLKELDVEDQCGSGGNGGGRACAGDGMHE